MTFNRFRLFVAILFVFILVFSFVLSCSAAFPYSSESQGLSNASAVYVYSLNNTTFRNVPLTLAFLSSTETGFQGLNISAIIDWYINTVGVSNPGEIYIIPSFPTAYHLSTDFLSINIPSGLSIKARASGTDMVTGNPLTLDLPVYSTIDAGRYVYNVYHALPTSAQLIPRFNAVSSFYITLSVSNISLNTFSDFIDDSITCTFGQGFYNYLSHIGSDYIDGYNSGFQDGRLDLNDSIDDAYSTGRDDGYNDGLSYGEEIGYSAGFDDGYSDGYRVGFDEGFTSEGFDLSMIPEAYIGTAYNYIVQLFNFNLFGWNLLGVIGAIMVLVVVSFIIKKVV